MEAVRQLRRERELSQQALADLANVNKVTLVRIEGGIGNPNVETLAKLANALEVEIADFFPKAQAPLPFDDEERRPSVYAGAIASAAERWLQIDTGANVSKIFGVIDAALDLEHFLGAHMEEPGCWEGLSVQERNEFGRVVELLTMVASEHLAWIEEQIERKSASSAPVDLEEFRRRRDRIRDRQATSAMTR